MQRNAFVTTGVIGLLAGPIAAQEPVEVVRSHVQNHRVEMVEELRILQAPFVVVPTVNHDNNQHARNENVRLGHFFRSVEILAAAATAQVRAVP